MQHIIKSFNAFKLAGMAYTLEERVTYANNNKLSYSELLELLCEDEKSNRYDNSYQRRKKAAKLPVIKQLEDFDFSFQPSIDKKLISDLAKLVGIIDYDYTTSELGDFIAYWLGRPESQFSEYQWTQKFVFNIKKMRLAHGFKNVQKVGQQIVQTKAGIVADENAKNLVAKYSKTNSE